MMKKFLLISLLCFAPIFATHAADLTEQDCQNFGTYWLGLENRTTENFQKLPASLQDVLKKKENLRQWISSSEISTIEEKIGLVFVSCLDANENTDATKTRYLKRATLSLEDIENYMKTLETRARMPFVHDGNVLPGPSTEEDGSFYVEQKFIPKFVNGTLIFLMSLSILMIIVGGLMFLFSSGDSDLTARAKTTIIWSVVGVIITILAYAIVQFIIGIDFTLG